MVTKGQAKYSMSLYLLLSFVALFDTAALTAQRRDQVLKASGMPVEPKVAIVWHRYYDADALETLLRKIANAYPRLARLQSIGKSYQGRDIWCLTVTDFKAGDPNRKPAIYVQGNIHGGELQGGEFTLYIAWYLTETHFDTPAIQSLLAEKVFYLVPTVNPDARQNFIHQGNSGGSSRWSMKAVDDYRDPKVMTDGWADFDGDGSISQLRRPNPYGIYRARARDTVGMGDMRTFSLMVEMPRDSLVIVNGKRQAKEPSTEHYDLFQEGGEREDSVWKRFSYQAPKSRPVRDEYDLNRYWGWSRSPGDSISDKDSQFWFRNVEQRVVREFFLNHPNISVALSFHNSSGELYPGKAWRENEDSTHMDAESDLRLYDAIGKHYERLVPGYAYGRSSGPGLGREIDWMFGARGVYALLPELMTYRRLYGRALPKEQNWDSGVSKPGYDELAEMLDFDRDLLFNDAFVPWHPVQHPALGKVEVGGWKKNFPRLHPGFLMLEDAHRHMAFAAYLAYQTPRLEVQRFTTRAAENGEQEITAVIANTRMLPTHSGPDLKYGISRPVILKLAGAARVISAVQVDEGSRMRLTPLQRTRQNPEWFEIASIPGKSAVTVQFVVEGTGEYSLTVDAVKGGVATRKSGMADRR